VRHLRFDAYSAEQVLLNKHQRSQVAELIWTVTQYNPTSFNAPKAQNPELDSLLAYWDRLQLDTQF